jgi:hypothetical protein
MRNESWFRGPLLSVLFFGLLIGGAPSMAAAHSSKGADGCTVHGCTSDHKYTDGSKHQTVCDSFQAMEDAGTGAMFVGGMFGIFGGPAGMGVGAIVGGAGLLTHGIGWAAKKAAGC